MSLRKGHWYQGRFYPHRPSKRQLKSARDFQAPHDDLLHGPQRNETGATPGWFAGEEDCSDAGEQEARSQTNPEIVVEETSASDDSD